MLSVALPKGETQVEDEPIMGTIGYKALEQLKYGVYSEKTDVFSFGSLLLDLLSRMEFVIIKAIEHYVPSCIRNHTINEIVDPTILAEGGGAHHNHQFQAVYQLGLEYRRDNAKERPIMLDVAKQLKRIQRYIYTFLDHS